MSKGDGFPSHIERLNKKQRKNRIERLRYLKKKQKSRKDYIKSLSEKFKKYRPNDKIMED